MLETVEHREERAAVEGLLASGILDRAPHLFNFLTYVCDRYFEGQSHRIKEYTIGVEALNRPSTFDPKKDSIVRVEAHRLRRRLNDYYASDGAAHPVQIVIPNGQYVPQFVTRSIVVEEPVEMPAAPAAEIFPGDFTFDVSPDIPITNLPETAETTIKPGNWKWLAASLLVLLCIALPALLWRRTQPVANGPTPPPAEETWTGQATKPVAAEFRMLAGYRAAPFIDSQGRSWEPDQYFAGGHSSAVSSSRPIKGVPDSSLLQTQREGQFRYDIPLSSGTHELRLYFVETEYGPGNPRGGNETARLFHIGINGKDAINWFDAIAEAGGANQLVVRVWKDIEPAADGKLHLTFRPAPAPDRPVSPAFLNAIEIVKSARGHIQPVRIVAQGKPIVDAAGRTWSSDQYFFGGNRVFRNIGLVKAKDQALYRGERYGNFSYHIPLVPGKYRLTLHFAETWFGTPESNAPALDSRRFNVFANGAALLTNFEIAKEAGVNHEVVKVFTGLQPNAQGALWLEFVPVENYAEVNAIEIEQTE